MLKLLKHLIIYGILFTCVQTQEKKKEEQKDDELSQSLVITVCVLLIFGLLYFAYNFYVCHKKKIAIGQEDDEEERPQEIEFQDNRKEQRIY